MLGRLTRSHLSFLVAFSALSGYLYFPASPALLPALLLSGGVWLLSAGASALNQAQERDVDARMERTRTRPLATGRLALPAGLSIAILLVTSGLVALAGTGSPGVFLLGLFAVAWYNGIYTPLKRVTPFAVLPGALCGALPPIMGWVLAGGGMFDYPILTLAGIVVLWQVPHFWLLALSYPDDARRSGLPDLFTRIRPERLRHLSCIWIIALLAGVAIANIQGLVRGEPGRLVIAVAMLLLAGALIRYRRRDPEPAASTWLFVRLNIFMALLFTVFALDRFSAHGDLLVSVTSLLG